MDRLHDLHAAARQVSNRDSEQEEQRDGDERGSCKLDSSSDDNPNRRGKDAKRTKNACKGRSRAKQQQRLPSPPIAPEDENVTLLKIMTCFRNITMQLQTIRACEVSTRERQLTGGALSSSSTNHSGGIPDSMGTGTVRDVQEAFQSAQNSLLSAYKLRSAYWEETNALQDHLALLRVMVRREGGWGGEHVDNGDGIGKKDLPLAKDRAGEVEELTALERRIERREQKTKELEEEFAYLLDQLWTAEREKRSALVADVARQLRVRLQAMSTAQQEQLIASMRRGNGNNTTPWSKASGDDKYADLDAASDADIVAIANNSTDSNSTSQQKQRYVVPLPKGGSEGKPTMAENSGTAVTADPAAMTDEELCLIAEALVDRSGGAVGTDGNPMYDTQVFTLSAHELQRALETRDAIYDIESRMRQLYQLFSDVSVLVHAQGEQMDSIVSAVRQSNAAVTKGRAELKRAKHYKRRCGCGCCCALM